MTKSLPLALLFAAVPAMAQPKVNSLTGEFLPSATGTIRDNLPRPPLEPARKIIYPKPGEIIIDTSRVCGDGDVEEYADHRPSFDIMRKADQEVLLSLGVLVRSGTSYSWFPSAAGAIPAVVPFTTTKLKAVSTGAETPLMSAAVTTLQDIQSQAGFKMPGGNAAKGEVFLGAMICKPPAPGTAATAPRVPPKARIGTLFREDVQVQVASAVDAAVAANNLAALDKFAVTSDAERITVAFGSGPASTAGDGVMNLGRNVFKMSYPCGGGCSLQQYQDAMNATSEAKALADLYTAFRSASSCARLPRMAGSKEQFWWEPLPLQLACEALAGNGSFTSLGGGLLNPAAVPTAAEFENFKKGVATLLLKSGALQQAQIAFDKTYASEAERHGCLPAAGPFIDKVLNMLSVGESLKSKGQVSFKSVHPEGNFAIGAYSSYYALPQGNDKTATGLGGDAQPLFELMQGSGPSFDGASKLGTSSILLQMRIRALGCCGQDPCFC